VGEDEAERTDAIKRLRRAIAGKWPESARKALVLSLLDEMILEADQTGA